MLSFFFGKDERRKGPGCYFLPDFDLAAEDAGRISTSEVLYCMCMGTTESTVLYCMRMGTTESTVCSIVLDRLEKMVAGSKGLGC